MQPASCAGSGRQGSAGGFRIPSFTSSRNSQAYKSASIRSHGVVQFLENTRQPSVVASVVVQLAEGPARVGATTSQLTSAGGSAPDGTNRTMRRRFGPKKGYVQSSHVMARPTWAR